MNYALTILIRCCFLLRHNKRNNTQRIVYAYIKSSLQKVGSCVCQAKCSKKGKQSMYILRESSQCFFAIHSS